MAMSRKTVRLLAYGAIYVFWGGSFLAIRDMVAVTPPFFSAAIRFCVAGVALYAFSRWRGGAPVRGRALWNSLLAGRAAVHHQLWLPLLGGDAHRLRHGRGPRGDDPYLDSAGRGSGPAHAAAGIFPIAIATLLGIIGVCLVTRSIGLEHSMLSGVLVELFGSMVFSFATLWSRALVLPDDQAQRAGLQMALGSVGLFIVSGIAGELPRIPAALAAWQWHTVVSFAYLVTCASILAFTSYTWLIHHEPATRVASYAYVNPLIALVVGVTLGGENISALQLAGAAMIILGVVATMLSKSKMPAAQPEPTVASR